MEKEGAGAPLAGPLRGAAIGGYGAIVGAGRRPGGGDLRSPRPLKPAKPPPLSGKQCHTFTCQFVCLFVGLLGFPAGCGSVRSRRTQLQTDQGSL